MALAAADLDLESWVQEHMEWLFGFRLRPFQLQDLCELLRGGIFSILWPTDHGKQVADDVMVPVSDGWKAHGDLQPGDLVFGPDGKQTPVIAVTRPKTQDLEVFFSDGTSVPCHADHEWTVWNKWQERSTVVETKKLVQLKLTYPCGNGNGRMYDRSFYLIRRPVSLQLPHANVPIDPYTLGAWLGDGRSEAPVLCGASLDLTHIDARVPYPRGHRSVHKTTGVVYQYYYDLRWRLQQAGVFCDKHIPLGYLRASEGQRRALLAGLIDTDGYVAADGKAVFSGANERLVRGVAALARTLGYRSSICRTIPSLRPERTIVDRQPIWTAQWVIDDGQSQGSLPRKATVFSAQTRRKIGIVGVEATTPRMGRCIQVARPDGLYVIGESMIPTHNSSVLIQGSVTLGLIREPRRPNIVLKISDDKARETLVAIARRLLKASERYPEVRPRVRWTQGDPLVSDGFYVDGSDLSNENPSIFAAGIATRDIQGRRGRTHIDDIESYREAQSPAYQRILEAQVSSATRTLEPGANALWFMCGTPYYADSVMFTIPRRLQSLGPRFRLIRRPVMDAEGRSLWEERRVKAEIHRAAMPSELEWQVAYLLEPPDHGKLSEQEAEKLLEPRYPFCQTQADFVRWFQSCEAIPPRTRKDVAGASWYIGWDPSAVGEFGIVADAIIGQQAFLLDAVRQPGDIFVQLGVVAELKRRYPAATIVIEKNGQQQVISDVLHERLPDANIVTHMTKSNIKSLEVGIPPLLQRGVQGYLRLPAGDQRGRNVASVVMREVYGYPSQHGHLLPALWFTTYFHSKNAVMRPVAARSERARENKVISIDMSRINGAWSRDFQGWGPR